MLTALTILFLFAAAWAVSRLSALIARRGLTWYDRRHHAPTGDLRAKIIELKRRETTVGVIRTGIAYIAFALAVVFAAAQLTGGLDRLSTIAGASFVLILVAFSAQRVLVDIIAGFSMFTEKWYSVGDTIAIPTMELQGIVEEVSLRRTKLRSLDGEVINIHNSQIPATARRPRCSSSTCHRSCRWGPRRSSSVPSSTRSTSSHPGSCGCACARRLRLGASGSCTASTTICSRSVPTST
jgi:Mechanosensitive ion channel